MKAFSAFLAIYAGNSPVTGEFPAQRLVTRSFDVFFDLRLNERLSNQSWGWWFETPWRPLWRHNNTISLFWPHYTDFSWHLGNRYVYLCLLVTLHSLKQAVAQSFQYPRQCELNQILIVIKFFENTHGPFNCQKTYFLLSADSCKIPNSVWFNSI